MTFYHTSIAISVSYSTLLAESSNGNCRTLNRRTAESCEWNSWRPVAQTRNFGQAAGVRENSGATDECRVSSVSADLHRTTQIRSSRDLITPQSPSSQEDLLSLGRRGKVAQRNWDRGRIGRTHTRFAARTTHIIRPW